MLSNPDASAIVKASSDLGSAGAVGVDKGIVVPLVPHDAGILRGQQAISAMSKDSKTKVGEPNLTTVEVKRLSPRAPREKPRAKTLSSFPASMPPRGKRCEVAGCSQSTSGIQANS